jgi:RNA polymerase sigma factor (sigma-70 family)
VVNTAGLPDHASRGERARLTLTCFRDFYAQWWPPLVRCLIAQANDSRWAEDVAQETMLLARDNWERLLTFERPDAWLFKVAIRTLRRLEARTREYPGNEPDTGDLMVAAAMDDWVATHLDVVAAIRSLPRRQGEAVVLHSLAGYTFAETAQILGIAEPSAKEHHKRACRRLQQLLDPASPAGIPNS